MNTKLPPLLLARYGLAVIKQHVDLGLISWEEYLQQRASFRAMIKREKANEDAAISARSLGTRRC